MNVFTPPFIDSQTPFTSPGILFHCPVNSAKNIRNIPFIIAKLVFIVETSIVNTNFAIVQTSLRLLMNDLIAYITTATIILPITVSTGFIASNAFLPACPADVRNFFISPNTFFTTGPYLTVNLCI